MARIRWDSVPWEVRDVVGPLLKRYRAIIPTWCHTLIVCYNVDPDNVASTEARHEYRYAKLYISGAILRETDAERADTIAHELYHVAEAPLRTAVAAIIEECVPEDQRALAIRTFTTASESVTSDMARTLAAAFPDYG